MVVDVGFAGFATGSTVTIGGVTVDAWGVTSDGGEVWEMTPTPGVSVTINVIKRSDRKLAPEGISFNTTLSGFTTNTLVDPDSYEPCLHDKIYLWDYGEGYTFGAPTQVLALDALDGGKRSNSRYSRGPTGAHVYRTTGDKTIRVAVIELSTGNIGIGSLTLSGADGIGDPNAYFSGTNTLFVSTASDWTNKPSGAAEYNSVSTALDDVEVSSTPQRIMLQRGETHTITSTLQYRPNTANVCFWMEAAPGAGARPILQADSSLSSQILFDRSRFEDNINSGVSVATDGTVVQGIDFHGNWDTSTESGNWYCIGFSASENPALHTVIDQCDFRNLERGTWFQDPGGTPSDNHRFVCDCAVSGWSDYAHYGGHGGSYFIGSEAAQDVDALAGHNEGGSAKKGLGSNHGPHRVANPYILVMASCDIYSGNGWSPIGSIQGIQPAIRFFASGAFAYSRVTMSDSVIEGPGIVLNLAAANDDENSRVRNAVFEGNLLLGGCQSNKLVNITNSGLTMRRNVMVFPATNNNMTGIGGQNRSPAAFVQTDAPYDWVNSNAENAAGKIIIEDNDMINLNSGSNAVAWHDPDARFSNVDVQRNMMHQPNGTASVPNAPVTGSLSVTLRWPGYRDYQTALNTSFAAPATDVKWTPGTGSAALDGGGNQILGAVDFVEDYQEG